MTRSRNAHPRPPAAAERGDGARGTRSCSRPGHGSALVRRAAIGRLTEITEAIAPDFCSGNRSGFSLRSSRSTARATFCGSRRVRSRSEVARVGRKALRHLVEVDDPVLLRLDHDERGRGKVFSLGGRSSPPSTVVTTTTRKIARCRRQRTLSRSPSGTSPGGGMLCAKLNRSVTTRRPILRKIVGCQGDRTGETLGWGRAQRAPPVLARRRASVSGAASAHRSMSRMVDPNSRRRPLRKRCARPSTHRRTLAYPV